jgi:hypothetical protein
VVETAVIQIAVIEMVRTFRPSVSSPGRAMGRKLASFWCRACSRSKTAVTFGRIDRPGWDDICSNIQGGLMGVHIQRGGGG